MHEIIDDFLPKAVHKKILDVFEGSHFPWYYTKNSTGKAHLDEVSHGQFAHIFFRSQHPQYMHSVHFKLVEPMLEIIKPNILIRIKANSTAPVQGNNKVGDFHLDYSSPKGMVGIYYVNTNDGATVLENGEVIESVENRFVKFSSDIKHAVKRHTNVKNRIVINFNWLD
tara:strand:- start:952 stop:1458 length:507 start_codon:yes stop_codon:yes gene_type:complete